MAYGCDEAAFEKALQFETGASSDCALHCTRALSEWHRVRCSTARGSLALVSRCTPLCSSSVSVLHTTSFRSALLRQLVFTLFDLCCDFCAQRFRDRRQRANDANTMSTAPNGAAHAPDANANDVRPQRSGPPAFDSSHSEWEKLNPLLNRSLAGQPVTALPGIVYAAFNNFERNNIHTV